MAPMHDMPAGGIAAMGIFFLFWLVMMVVMLAGWIVFLVAAWRGMKAHERLATALENLTRSRAEIPK
jgi:uncharacterized membrane protein